ncbi:MAG: DUF7091 family protein [Halodesulfurarchaeum sp.]
MADLELLVRSAARKAGRTVGIVGVELAGGRIEGSLPRDEAGRVRIVCRRWAERRTVPIEGDRPACYEASNADCESCVADIREGVVETWRP